MAQVFAIPGIEGASEMMNSGANLYKVGAVLGHRRSQSTKRYAHLAADTLAFAIGLIGRNPARGKNKAPRKGP